MIMGVQIKKLVKYYKYNERYSNPFFKNVYWKNKDQEIKNV